MGRVKDLWHDQMEQEDDDMARYEAEMQPIVSPYLNRDLRPLQIARDALLKENVGWLLSSAQRVERQLSEGAKYDGDYPAEVVALLRRIATVIEEQTR